MPLGSEPATLDRDRRTPLIHAARLGDLGTTRLLFEAETYVVACDRFHQSAVFYVVDVRRRDIVLYLTSNGHPFSLTIKEKKASR